MSGTATPGRGHPLASNRSFRRLWLARTTSQLGDGAALVALLLYVKSSTSSGAAVGVLLLAQALPRLLGPVAGVVVDRSEQRFLMIACDLGQAFIFLGIALFEPSFLALVGLVALAAALETLFAPAGASVVPAMVAPAELLRANAWLGTSLNLRVALGSLIGGVLVSAFGPRGGLGANAISFLLSAALLARLPKLRAAPSGVRGGFLSEGRAGLAFAWGHPVVRAVVVALFLGVAFAAVDNVALVFLARDTLRTTAFGFSVMVAGYGVGMLLVSLALSWGRLRADVRVLFLGGWLLNGLGILGTGLAPTLPIAVVAQTLAGTGNGLTNIGSNTLVQRSVPGALLGRVFGVVGTAPFLGQSVAMLGAGLLVDATSPRLTLVLGGAGVLCVLVLMAAMLRGRPASSNLN